MRALLGSRFAAALGIATLAYGAMVYLATIEAPQIVISLVGATRFLAALLFGISGGVLINAMSKRTAIVTAYTLQAAACFVIPTLWGTSITSLVVLVFIVASLGQLATPAVKATTALVSTVAQVAVVAAIISVAQGIGAAMGSAFLSPLLINLADLRTIIYISGLILALGAVRSLWLPGEAASLSLVGAARQVEWRRTLPSLQRAAEWLSANRVVGALLLVGAMGMALFESMNTLMPVYVRDVLESDPTNTIYITSSPRAGSVSWRGRCSAPG